MAQENNNEPVIVVTHSTRLWNLPAHRARCLETMLYLEMVGAKYEGRMCK